MLVPLLWNWISGICQQKRILLLLCAFGFSFILLNYSLLSSSSSASSFPTTATRQSQDLSYSSNKDEVDDFIISIRARARTSGQEKYAEEANRNGRTLQLSSSSERVTLPLPPSTKPIYMDYSSGERSESDMKINSGMYPFPVEQPTLYSIREHYYANNDFYHLNNLKSNTEGQGKPKVMFISAIENRSRNEPNRVIKYRIGHTTSDSNNDYANAREKTAERNQAEEATSSINPFPPPEQSIIAVTGNQQSSVNNEMGSESIVYLPISSSSPSSSSPSPIDLQGVGESPSPDNVLEPSPPSPVAFTTSRSKLATYPSNSNNSATVTVPTSTSNNLMSSSSLSSPFKIPSCNTPTQLRRVQKRKKNLTVIENFIMGWKRVRCNESITYTTHGDFRYLDNLVPLAERWDGPISLSIYCPGADLEKTLGIISYLKSCTSSKIDEWVNFHLIYDVKFSTRPKESKVKPGDISWLDSLYQNGKWTDCSTKPAFSKFDHTFRIENGLLYPINIARNIARAAATTYFVLASDIELYPSINLIPNFMKMLSRLQSREDEGRRIISTNLITNTLTSVADSIVGKLLFPSLSTVIKGSDSDNNNNNQTIKPSLKEQVKFTTEKEGHRLDLSTYPHRSKNKPRHVFVLPVFEVRKEVLPCQAETKEQLLTLMKKRAAVIFHHSICPQCHTFPKFEQWKAGLPSEVKRKSVNCTGNNNSTDSFSNSPNSSLNIFHKAKRKFPYHLWEPIFIGTKDEPIYDERLSWEGLRDKMVSGYVMCALDYDFYILDNAFLVHKPGIRRIYHLVTKTVMNQDRLINYRIRSELLKKFGKHDECAL